MATAAAAASGVVFVGCAAVRAAAQRRRSKTTMQVRRRPLPIAPEKRVMATRRLPLWRLSDEMYLNRQIAPSPDGSWTEIRQVQARMKEQVIEQQKADMRTFEKELSGWRMEPKYPVGELREGMWLEGRVSATGKMGTGVMVDVGAYTERGEWIDGFLHMSQIREDGRYVSADKLMHEVHLGEQIRVRVRQVVPATGTLLLSMLTEEDLPPLFFGAPRPYSYLDLKVGMKLTGIVRRSWERSALVDIGADRLARIHVQQHKRRPDKYGFIRKTRFYKWAFKAYPKGAVIDCWVHRLGDFGSTISLTCIPPRSPDKPEDLAVLRRGSGPEGFQMAPPNPERTTKEQRADREKAEKEKENWDPYVPHVDEWLEDAMEPDEETDSWVARTEKELFDEEAAEEAEEERLRKKMEKTDKVREMMRKLREEDSKDISIDEFGEDDFDEDEFAEDDFASNPMEANSFGFGEHAFAASELDGWVTKDEEENEAADSEKADKGKSLLPPDPQELPPSLSEKEIQTMFDMDDDDEDVLMGGGGWGGDRPPPR